MNWAFTLLCFFIFCSLTHCQRCATPNECIISPNTFESKLFHFFWPILIIFRLDRIVSMAFAFNAIHMPLFHYVDVQQENIVLQIHMM